VPEVPKKASRCNFSVVGNFKASDQTYLCTCISPYQNLQVTLKTACTTHSDCNQKF